MMSIGKVKFIILRSNDRKIAGKSLSTVTETSTARIVEIEVTGSESVEKVVEKPASDDSEEGIENDHAIILPKQRAWGICIV